MHVLSYLQPLVVVYSSVISMLGRIVYLTFLNVQKLLKELNKVVLMIRSKLKVTNNYYVSSLRLCSVGDAQERHAYESEADRESDDAQVRIVYL